MSQSNARGLLARIEPRWRRRYALGLAIFAADALLTAVPLLTATWAVHALSMGQSASRTGAIAIGLVVATFVIRLAVLPIGVALGFRSGYASVGALRLALFDHLRRLPLALPAGVTGGGISDLVTNRFRYLEEEAGYAFGRQIGHATLALALIAALAFVHLVFPVAIALLVVLIALAYRDLDRVFEGLAREQGARMAVSAERMVDFLAGLPVLRTLGQVGQRSTDYRATVEAIHRFYRGAIWQVTPLIGAMRVALDLAALALVALAVTLLTGAWIGPADFIVALILILLLLVPLEASVGEGFMLRLAIDAHRRAVAILALPTLPDGSEPRARSGDVVFEQVGFAYGDAAAPTFQDLSVTLPAGKVTAIIGPSGAGKSTLLNLIARSYDVDAGRITIGGQDIRAVPLYLHLVRLSVVWQDVFLFDTTVEGNLKVARATADAEVCRGAAAAACCARMIEALPDGYATRLGDAGRKLSGGERQRIGIARAMLKDAEIVLLDEPTSALDAENERDATSAMRALFENRTVVVVAHRLRTIADADHIVVMDGGRIVDAGDHDTLRGRCVLYRDLWDAYDDTDRWRLTADASSAS